MKIKKLIAAVLCVAMLFTMLGCTTKDTTWAAEMGSEQMYVGTYIFYLLNAYDLATTKVEDLGDKDVLKETIEDVPAEQWIRETALKDVKRYYATEKQFADAGLTVSDADKADINTYVQEQITAYGDFLSKNGIDEKGLTQYYTNNFKSNTLFMNTYGKDGEKAVPEEEITKTFKDTFITCQYLLMPRFDSATGVTYDEYGQETVKLVAESYYQTALKTENFEDVILQWEKEAYGVTEESHNHDTPGQHDLLMTKNSTDVPEVFRTKVSEAKVGDILLFDDAQYYYIAKRIETKSDAETIDSYRNQLLMELGSDEYKQTLEGWITEIENDIKINQDAISFYTPAKLKVD